MAHLDAALQGVAETLRGTNSRYADDLYFSTDVSGACHQFAIRSEKLVERQFSSALCLNEDKTLYMSRGTRRIVAGLFLTPEGSVSIGRRRKKYIKKLVHDFRKGAASNDLKRELRGHLGFVLDVEPGFFNNLAMKYGADILSRVLSWADSNEDRGAP
jgi:RNA-directed DNA polymerase